MQMSQLPSLRYVVLAVGVATIACASEAYASAAYEIGVYQNLCDVEHGYSTFKKQVGCIKSAIETSGSKSDPEMQLYVLTADKLLDDVRGKRTSTSAARVELQKAYLHLVREDARASQVATSVAQTKIEQERQDELQKEAIRACVSHAELRLFTETDSQTQLELMKLLGNRDAVVA